LRMPFSAVVSESPSDLPGSLAKIDVERDESPEDRLYEKVYAVRSPITIKHYII